MYPRTRSIGALIFIVVLTLTLCATANAAFVMDRYGELTGTGKLEHLTLYSLVTVDAGVYTYAYDLTYDVGTVATAEVFSVANWEDLPFFGAANNDGFTDPDYVPFQGEVLWVDGFIALNETVHFSYQSIYGPSEISVYAYAIDGGYFADGYEAALGMTTAIPEPASVAGLALGILGFVPIALRRRK